MYFASCIVMLGMFLGTTADHKQTAFQVGLQFVLQSEGGYVNNPHDHGGATNKGITQRRYNMWRKAQSKPAQSVKEIKNTEVAAIYHEYWKEAHCSEIVRLGNPKLAIVQFDWAVNSGVSRAIKTLQECVGTKPDGLWGPHTIEALRKSDSHKVFERYLEARVGFYQKLAKKKGQKIFLQGWLNRVKALRVYLAELDTSQK